MCGISGVLSLSGRPVERSEVAKMNQSLSHRGPDGEGIWVSQNQLCVLGHRRLAIIDTDPRSNQPMPSADGRFIIVFNGEIYNFVEVRKALESKGHVFHTEGDTEVILQAWREWGDAMHFHFNGMWAIAIYDTEQKSLFLSRDRFAEKPLFYVQSGDFFAFASEMKALLSLPWCSSKLDMDVVSRAAFDTYSIEGTERTHFKQVRRLPHGHMMSVDKSGIKKTRWWRTTDHLVTPPSSLSVAAEEFWDRFQDSTQMCMRADVPIGTCLSGGFDSTAIVATMSHLGKSIRPNSEHQADDWRHAFVATFPGMSNDETVEAKLAARYAGISNVVLKNMTQDGPLDYLETSMASFEGISLGVPNAAWRIYETVRKSGVVVSLDGHGVDEMMGGYRRVEEDYKFKMRNLLGNASGRHRLFNIVSDHVKFRFLQGQGNMFLRHRLGPPEAFRNEALHDVLPDNWGTLNRRFYAMFHATVLPTLMKNFDRMSMAHGVEVRSPFLDWRLVTFVFSLPDEMKSNATFSKLVAREAMRNRMPEEIRSSTSKKGFASQMPEWLNGALGEWAAKVVATPNDAFESQFDGKALGRRILALNAKRNWTWDNSARIWPYVHAKWLCDKHESGVSVKASP
jgi:asparagine synthase (glutamine-hydrolysing)